MHGTERSILIVDDDPGILRCVSTVVADAGLNPLPAQSQEEALERALATTLSGSILDMFVRDRTGLETLELLWRVSGPIPTVMMSGAFTDELRSQAERAGVITTLDKPLDVAALRDAVARLLNSA